MEKPTTLTPAAQLNAIRLLFFLFYASQGVLFTFLVVYYYSIGMSGMQIGWINTVTPLVSMVAGVLWSVANDRIGRTRLILVVALVGTILSGLGIGAVRTFPFILLLAGSLNFFYKPVTPILDNLALKSLGEDRDQRYGRIRLWGAIGYSICALATGYLLTYTGMKWLFLGNALVLGLMAAALFLLPDQRVEVKRPELRNFVAFVKDPDWIVFILCACFVWFNDSGVFTFFPVYMKQMGANEATIGVMNSVQSLSEALFLFLSVYIFRRFKLENLLAVAMFFYALRTLLYSFIPSPGWAIPLGLLHSVSFGMYIVCAVNFVYRLSPEGFKTTGQGLYAALGSLVLALSASLHGWLFDHAGAVTMFRIDSALGFVGLGLFVVWFLVLKRRPRVAGYRQ